LRGRFRNKNAAKKGASLFGVDRTCWRHDAEPSILGFTEQDERGGKGLSLGGRKGLGK